ncbi:xanthine dehydrogenase family protein subunit M [Pseudooceanicola sediminis]|uniref:Xanthine dehydrogenase family protein subunit M n=1 Tax=Pseudooceanicola sediminis TaxID=2211117 RepID=A0A399IXL7_9RHOB|nr:xanthine dehydrogenase family protein subunit M [Pseudooceanicola sediminis]RII37865.1 xanthine dehydrogenase family protein subunit M [Pseudooceanicola sediminis]|tara:strand:+ start:57855 stop:58901 length:1047 start_codon:yes stop_codon:yes gene_type:complete
MKPFQFLRPRTLSEAAEALRRPGAMAYGGGTNLLDLMKSHARTPDVLVDMTAVSALQDIALDAAGDLRIGAAVRNATLARSPLLQRHSPMVAEALLSGASAQIRNMATVAGNLLQETRCAHFSNPDAGCGRRDGGQECDARLHAGREHAVIGWSESCRAVHPSDFCVPLVALDAMVEIVGPSGLRRVALADFLLLPGDTPQRRTQLGAGDFITGLILPAAAAGFAAHGRYLKVRERTSFAFALVSAAAAVQIKEGRILAARLALGGVAPKPWRVTAAEDCMGGRPPTADVFRAAAEIALSGAAASGDNGFKIELAKRTVVRAFERATVGVAPLDAAMPASVFDTLSKA